MIHSSRLRPSRTRFLFPLMFCWINSGGSKRLSVSPAGRSQRSVGAQGSTAWVRRERRPRPQRHEPHQGRLGDLHRQLAPVESRAGQEDRRVSIGGSADVAVALQHAVGSVWTDRRSSSWFYLLCRRWKCWLNFSCWCETRRESRKWLDVSHLCVSAVLLTRTLTLQPTKI